MVSHGHKPQFNVYSNIHGKKTSASKHTSTPAEFMICQKCKQTEAFANCNTIGDYCNGTVVGDYIKAINYINSCHSIINEITKKSSSEGNNPTFNMPEMPNFLAIFQSLSGNSNPLEKEQKIDNKPAKQTENASQQVSTKYIKSDIKNKPQSALNIKYKNSNNDTQTSDTENEYEITHKISYRSCQNQSILQKVMSNDGDVETALQNIEHFNNKHLSSKNVTQTKIPTLSQQRKKINTLGNEFFHGDNENKIKNPFNKQQITAINNSFSQSDHSIDSSPRSSSPTGQDTKAKEKVNNSQSRKKFDDEIKVEKASEPPMNVLAFLQQNDNNINPNDLQYYACSAEQYSQSHVNWQNSTTQKPIIISSSMDKNHGGKRPTSPPAMKMKKSRSPSPKNYKQINGANSKNVKVLHTKQGTKTMNSVGSIILSDSDPIFSDSDIDEDTFQDNNNISQTSERYGRVIPIKCNTPPQNGFFFGPPSPRMEEHILKASKSRVNINVNAFRRPRQQLTSDDDDDKIIKFSSQGEPKLYRLKLSSARVS